MKTYKKYVIILVLIGMTLPMVAVHASDGGGSWAQYGAFFTKEYILDTIARAAAGVIYQRMVDAIASTISTLGPDGGPAWIENWRRYFRKSQDTGRDIFAWQLYDAALGDRATICKFLADPISDAFGAAFNPDNEGRTNEMFRYETAQPFNLRTKCQFPDNFEYGKYINDWRFDPVDFQRMIESGDFLNLAVQSYEEQQRQIAAEFDTNKSEGVSGGGYQSVKKEGRIVTPGKILSDVQSATITKELDWLISVDELSELISSATVLVVNRLIDYGESVAKQDELRETPPPENNVPIGNQRLCNDICSARARAKCDVDQPTICKTSTKTNSDPTTGNGSTSGEEICTPATNEACRAFEVEQCKIDMQCTITR